MIQYVNVDVQYDQNRIFRRLKIKPETHVYEYATKVFPKLIQIVDENLDMVHCYAVLHHSPPVNIPEVDSCSHQVVCLSACLDQITQAIGNLLEKGDYLEGYLLNDLTNEILFNGSDQMNRQIAADLAKMDCRLTQRFSPGEGEMDLHYQASLLQCFREDQRLDFVKLTDSFMLAPEKSMLYIFGADRRNPGVSVEHDCSICPNKTCFFRVVKS